MKDRRPLILRIAKGTLMLLLLGLMTSGVYAATNSSGNFKDTVGHWASSSIKRLAGIGIISGYQDGSYKPDKQVSRAEVAVIGEKILNAVGYEEPATKDNIARGARLYDQWTVEAGAATPAGDQPLWASQTTNTRTGGTTWRCKECHGWDYKGDGGAYGSGSHATGFPGVFRASATMNKAELLEVLKGSTDYRHNFSSVLKDADLESLVDFIKEGLINDTKYINYSTKKPISANIDNGKQKYNTACSACHGADGTKLNFGSEKEPEYIGTIAGNPWEFIHKVQYGQPGATMPTAIQLGWSVQDILDVLAYNQTLPVK